MYASRELSLSVFCAHSKDSSAHARYSAAVIIFISRLPRRISPNRYAWTVCHSALILRGPECDPLQVVPNFALSTSPLCRKRPSQTQRLNKEYWNRLVRWNSSASLRQSRAAGGGGRAYYPNSLIVAKRNAVGVLRPRFANSMIFSATSWVMASSRSLNPSASHVATKAFVIAWTVSGSNAWPCKNGVIGALALRLASLVKSFSRSPNWKPNWESLASIESRLVVRRLYERNPPRAVGTHGFAHSGCSAWHAPSLYRRERDYLSVTDARIFIGCVLCRWWWILRSCWGAREQFRRDIRHCNQGDRVG